MVTIRCGRYDALVGRDATVAQPGIWCWYMVIERYSLSAAGQLITKGVDTFWRERDTPRIGGPIIMKENNDLLVAGDGGDDMHAFEHEDPTPEAINEKRPSGIARMIKIRAADDKEGRF